MAARKKGVAGTHSRSGTQSRAQTSDLNLSKADSGKSSKCEWMNLRLLSIISIFLVVLGLEYCYLLVLISYVNILVSVDNKDEMVIIILSVGSCLH